MRDLHPCVHIFFNETGQQIYIVKADNCVLTNASYTLLKIDVDVRWLNDHICKLDVCIRLLCILDIGFLDEISVLAFSVCLKKENVLYILFELSLLYS